ncbi:MAG: hypothetical protein AB7V77_04950 [Candidatus Woesearchaeota archaeon]
MNSINEALKRRKIADTFVKNFSDISKGVILAGSVAYGPINSVRADSDLDLLIFTSHPLKEVLPIFIPDNEEVEALKRHRFDGLCLKKYEQNIPISLHIFDDVGLFNIAKSYVTNLHVYRTSAKAGGYLLNNFLENESYNYFIKSITYPDIKGSRTMVPVMFRYEDKHYLGIHRDKIISGSKILLDTNKEIAEAVDSVWNNVAETLVDEAYRHNGKLDLDKMNILNALARKDRFDEQVTKDILNKTEEYVAKFK